MLVAGFVSRSMSHHALCDEMLAQGAQVQIPTLHVIGENDKVIEREMSDDMLMYFSQPDVYHHPGGHFVPTAGSAKTLFADFLAKMK